MDFPTQHQSLVNRIEAGIERLLPSAAARPARLHGAMRYSLQAGGKRLRPALVFAAAEAADPTRRPEDAPDPLPAAVAVECVHTYSLIHDDLPCMDDDDLRRGRPTAHKAFDEATALLAGDALLTHAFELLSTHYPAQIGLSCVRELATAAGSHRLIGGQMEDLLAEGKPDVTADDLEFIHLNKTAAMIEASLAIGGLVRGASDDTLASLRKSGRNLGLAFQILDDVLDATSDSGTLGKTAGKDARAGKATYVGLHGVDAARRLARELSAAAIADFRTLPGGAPFLVALTESMAARTK